MTQGKNRWGSTRLIVEIELEVPGRNPTELRQNLEVWLWMKLPGVAIRSWRTAEEPTNATPQET